MATHQFESAKKLILHFTQKNHMDPESDIKGVMPGEHAFPSTPGPHQVWGARQPPLQDRESPHHAPGACEGPTLPGSGPIQGSHFL